MKIRYLAQTNVMIGILIEKYKVKSSPGSYYPVYTGNRFVWFAFCKQNKTKQTNQISLDGYVCFKERENINPFSRITLLYTTPYCN